MKHIFKFNDNYSLSQDRVRNKMFFLLKQTAQKEIKTIQQAPDFSKGNYKKIYERWLDYHLTKDELSKKIKNKQEKQILELLKNFHLEELDLIFWFANHKPKNNSLIISKPK